MVLTFATLNVRGLNLRRKQYQLQRMLVDEQPDFLALQETKMGEDESISRMLSPYLGRYEIAVSHAVGYSAGCFLFLKQSVRYTNLQVVTDECGRFISCDFTLSGVDWRLICVYAPNNARERGFFFQLFAKLR